MFIDIHLRHSIECLSVLVRKKYLYYTLVSTFNSLKCITILLLLFQIFNTKIFVHIHFGNKKTFLLMFLENELTFYSFRGQTSHFQHLERIIMELRRVSRQKKTIFSSWYCMNASHASLCLIYCISCEL